MGEIIHLQRLPAHEEGSETMDISVKSPAFKDGEMIPSMYSCDGENISPPLMWYDPPENTETFVLISDDPDAPMGTWVHWVVYNIPPEIREFPKNIPSDPVMDGGSIQGITDFGTSGYGGPCPPSGTHRYFFKIYALDTTLPLGEGASKKDVVNAMKGHILAKGQIMGRYRRQQ